MGTETPGDSIHRIEATWMGFRLLLPFAFAREEVGPKDHRIRPCGIPAGIFDALRELRMQKHPVWESARPPALYTDEALGPVASAVFPADETRYWRIVPVVQDGLFRDASVELRAHGRVELVPCRPFGIELFLSNFGFGVLSIALEASLPSRDPAGAATELVYTLSQVLARKVLPVRRRASAAETETATSWTPTDAFRLPDLARFLLPFDVTPFGVGLDDGARPRAAFASGQFNAYSVVRLRRTPGHTFVDHPKRDAIGRFVTALAQIQEPHHAGNEIAGSHVVEKLLNRHHWAACTNLAAAHLVLDQIGQPEPDWNVQGPQHYLGKYFVPALLAHHQRRYAETVVAESRGAAQALMSGHPEIGDQINRIMLDLLQFELSAAFPTVSTRHVVNVWYEQCREGERAASALATAREAIARLDATLARLRNDEIAHASSENLHTVAHVQRNVEWIEIFIIAVYAMEAAEHLSKAWRFPHAYEKWSLLFLPLAAGSVAFWTLRMHELKEPGEKRPKQLRMLTWLVGLFLLWIILGLLSDFVLPRAH